MEFLRGCVFDDGKLHKGLDDFDSVGENPDDVRVNLIELIFNIIW